MTKIWQLVGRVVFWCSWPALWVYLRFGSRTRLLLICQDEFLVLRGWMGPNEWGLPGGGLHSGEEPINGLIREVREETGINLDKAKLKHAFAATSKNHGLRFDYDCYVYHLSQKPEVRIQHLEITGYAWVNLNSPTLPLASDAQAVLAWWQNKG